MVNVIFIDIFDAKIVDHQCEQDGSCFVMPQSWGMCTFVIPKGRKFAVEVFVCQNAGLWQAPHCLLHSKWTNLFNAWLVNPLGIPRNSVVIPIPDQQSLIVTI